MPITSAAIIGGSSLVSGLIGANAASSSRDAADAAKQQALQQWLKVNVPDPAQQAIELQKYQQTGTLSPQLEQTFKQQGTSLDQLALDPSSRQAEMSALAKMQDISSNNGMDAQGKAIEQQAINQSNASEQGQRGAIVQNFAQRGMGGAGAELQAQLLASQGDANQAATQGLNSASMAQQRALQAMTQGAQLASNINSQDYTQAANAAKAQDTINQFNASNSQRVAGANVDRSNQAAASNLATQQSIANQNVGVANTQETHNKGLSQQQFQNEATQAAGASGQYNNVANQDSANADRTANQWAGIGSAIGQGAAAYGQYSTAKAQTDAYNKRTDAMASGE